MTEKRQLVFKSILHEARNERALPISNQSDEELRRGVAELQMQWYERNGTQQEYKRYDALLAEILKRRNERQKS